MTAPERAPSAPTPDDHEGFAVTDAQLREVLAQEYLENARAVRSRSFTVPYAIMVIVLAFAPAIPRVSSILGGGIVITAPVFLGMLAIHLALVPLVRRNPKRYVAGDAFETAFHVAAYGLLIVSSGHALAIPWFFLSMNAQLAPLHPSRWVHRTAYATMPVVVAAVFEMRGQRDDALLSLVLGIAVLIILRVATSAVMERARSRVRIADLERKVERSRIAMELHDGIGADLTAVILRARTVADHAKDDDRETLDPRFLMPAGRIRPR